jgi:uncharacterized protein YfiM (DUF2279 family)
MVGLVVTFDLGTGMDRERVLGAARQAAPLFQGMSGLRLKVFTLDEAAGLARNVYVWESEEAARAFFTPEVVAQVTELYGVAPTLDYVEVAGLVDNARP